MREPRQSELGSFLGENSILVPVPGSAPLKQDALSPPQIICNRLLYSGFGAEIEQLLERSEAVPKSAFAKPGERPSINRHYETIRVQPRLVSPRRIILVDDVITRGRTAYACAWRLSEAFPEAEINVFAVIRTMGLVQDIDRILDPRVGEIHLLAGGQDVDRVP